MHGLSSARRSLPRFVAVTALSAVGLAAQVPPGHYVWGAFNPSRGPVGLYLSHPRNPGAPTAITGLQGDLATSGSSCVLYRASDGAILVGERAATGSSVDVHRIHLNGVAVDRDVTFSVGIGGPCCGEIPQMDWLPDGRIVVAATDLSSGPLALHQTTAYGIQGLGLLDPDTGVLTPVPITNAGQIMDVFNGLAAAPDGSAVYVGTYVTATQGDIWRVPLPGGGAATLVASVPAGLSHLAFDAAGALWVTTLDVTQGLFKVDLGSGAAVQVPQTNGSLNAIAFESVTGNFALVSANAGLPARSLFWMEPNGTMHMLTDPGTATISAVAIHHNPEIVAGGTPGSARYDWRLSPNPGGLPLVGARGFSLTLDATGAVRPGVVMVAAARAAAPFTVAGAVAHVDPGSIAVALPLPFAPSMTLPMPIPPQPSLQGVQLFVQSFHVEGPSSLSSSPALEFTVL